MFICVLFIILLYCLFLDLFRGILLFIILYILFSFFLVKEFFRLFIGCLGEEFGLDFVFFLLFIEREGLIIACFDFFLFFFIVRVGFLIGDIIGDISCSFFLIILERRMKLGLVFAFEV